MSVSEALRRPRDESEIEGAALFVRAPPRRRLAAGTLLREVTRLTGTNGSHVAVLPACLPEVGWR